MDCLRLRPERRQESMGKRSEAIEWRAQMTSSTRLAFLTAVITSPTFSMILVSSSLLLFFESFSMFFVFSIILFLCPAFRKRIFLFSGNQNLVSGSRCMYMLYVAKLACRRRVYAVSGKTISLCAEGHSSIPPGRNYVLRENKCIG